MVASFGPFNSRYLDIWGVSVFDESAFNHFNSSANHLIVKSLGDVRYIWTRRIETYICSSSQSHGNCRMKERSFFRAAHI